MIAFGRRCLLVVAATAGCAEWPAALSPRGIQAERIAGLWWFFLAVSTVVLALVVSAALYGAFRRRGEAVDDATVNAEHERRAARWIGGAVVASLLVLFVFVVVDQIVRRAVDEPSEPAALTIDLEGKQWWWEARYDNPAPTRQVTVANEIHVPVGRPVRFRLTSSDVIHSFWVPNLHGKMDLVPGYRSTIWFQADSPGVYRGQCAEFCGRQHAKMGILIVARPVEEFAAWYERQLQAAPTPGDSARRRGQEVFLAVGCALCHTIRGTPAGGRTGPDLTHLASRSTLAAGTIPNTRGYLAGWIADPQQIKPGTQMPPTRLSPDDLHALLDYLESLR